MINLISDLSLKVHFLSEERKNGVHTRIEKNSPFLVESVQDTLGVFSDRLLLFPLQRLLTTNKMQFFFAKKTIFFGLRMVNG